MSRFINCIFVIVGSDWVRFLYCSWFKIKNAFINHVDLLTMTSSNHNMGIKLV